MLNLCRRKNYEFSLRVFIKSRLRTHFYYHLVVIRTQQVYNFALVRFRVSFVKWMHNSFVAYFGLLRHYMQNQSILQEEIEASLC